MITYHTPSERLYFALPDDIIHIISIYDPRKKCLRNLFFIFYLLNMDISITRHCAALEF